MKRGATHVIMFSVIMNATSYGDILSASLLPLVRNTYPDNPKHTFKFIQIFFLQNGIKWWKSPAKSPDLNVWGSMKTYLCDKYKPRSLPELKEGISAYWGNLSLELCSRYIDHLQMSCPLLLKKRDTLQDAELSSMEEQFIVCANVYVIVVTSTVL